MEANAPRTGSPPPERIEEWRVGPSRFQATPGWGARLWSWEVTLAGSRRQVLVPPTTPPGVGTWVAGGNPILFPFAGRSFDQGEVGWWRAGDQVRRPMPLHGWAHGGRFRLLDLDPTGFTAQFEPGEAARTSYPFAYEFLVGYRFRELSLLVDLILRNHGTERLPWCPGHHFYFALPWRPGTRRADYRVEMDARKAWYHAADGSLAPTAVPPTRRGTAWNASLQEPAWQDRIHGHLRTPVVRFGPRHGEEDITLRLGDGGPPAPAWTIVTWSESEEAPFYCVEPWMGPPNSAGRRSGPHWVEPGGEGRFTVEVSLL